RLGDPLSHHYRQIAIASYHYTRSALDPFQEKGSGQAMKGGQESRNCCTSFSTSNNGLCMAEGADRFKVNILRFNSRNFCSYSATAFSTAALKARFSLG